MKSKCSQEIIPKLSYEHIKRLQCYELSRSCSHQSYDTGSDIEFNALPYSCELSTYNEDAYFNFNLDFHHTLVN